MVISGLLKAILLLHAAYQMKLSKVQLKQGQALPLKMKHLLVKHKGSLSMSQSSAINTACLDMFNVQQKCKASACKRLNLLS